MNDFLYTDTFQDALRMVVRYEKILDETSKGMSLESIKNKLKLKSLKKKVRFGHEAYPFYNKKEECIKKTLKDYSQSNPLSKEEGLEVLFCIECNNKDKRENLLNQYGIAQCTECSSFRLF